MRICIAEDCERFGRTRGLCDMHYQRNVRSGTYSTCLVSECEDGIVSAGMCEKHYRRELRARIPDNKSCAIASCERRPVGKGWCSKHYSLHKRYGIDPIRYEEILESQSGKCAICGSTNNLHMDHDHESNELRGVLCGSCNRAIGLLQDDFDIVSSAAKYLKEWKGENSGR